LIIESIVLIIKVRDNRQPVLIEENVE